MKKQNPSRRPADPKPPRPADDAATSPSAKNIPGDRPRSSSGPVSPSQKEQAVPGSPTLRGKHPTRRNPLFEKDPEAALPAATLKPATRLSRSSSPKLSRPADAPSLDPAEGPAPASQTSASPVSAVQVDPIPPAGSHPSGRPALVEKKQFPHASAARDLLIQQRMDQIKEHVGIRLKELREGKNLTQAKLAESVGCTPGVIFLLEHARNSVTLKMLILLAEVLNVEVTDFLPHQVQPDTKARLAEDMMRRLITVSKVIDEVIEINENLRSKS